MVALPEYFISCDWGTTNLRLHAVETQTLSVCARLPDGAGIKSVYSNFQQQQPIGQTEFFVDYLTRQLSQFPTAYRACPVVVSGMASATIGLQELPYAKLPIDGRGTSLTARWINGDGRSLLLVSGVYGDDSVMRGEEVQAIGLAEHMHRDGLLILPGTHSKHLVYRGGSFIGFSTYMTGELFALLVERSILSASVSPGDWDAAAREAFAAGLREGGAGNLTRRLFSVRVRDIVDGRSKSDNYHYLSGLLLGEELRGVAEQPGTVYLAAAGSLLSAYRLALEQLVPTERLVILGEEVLGHAVHSAHAKLLTYHA